MAVPALFGLRINNKGKARAKEEDSFDTRLSICCLKDFKFFIVEKGSIAQILHTRVDNERLL